MKKIFHFVKSNYLTGVENVVINICTLVHGYDYTFVSTKGPIEKYLKKYDIKHITVPSMNPLNIFRVIKKYKPDIVQAHDLRISVFMSLSYLYCKHHNIKMISELHNDDPKMKNWWGLRALLYLFSSFTYEHIIFVSKDILTNYAYNTFIQNKSRIIPNIVNSYRIKSDLLPLYKNKWDCMFLGRVTNQKNPLKFIKIIYMLKQLNANVKAVMVGDGDLLSIVKSKIKNFNLTKNIDVVGFKYNPFKYLQQSKILIMTSKYEGLPLVALESIIVGTPVVSTPLEVLKKILGKYGLFSNSNTSLTHISFNLINNKNQCNRIENEELIKVKHFNDITKFIKGYDLIYGK